MKRSMIALGSLLHAPFSFFVLGMNPMPGLVLSLVVIAAWPLFTKSEA